MLSGIVPLSDTARTDAARSRQWCPARQAPGGALVLHDLYVVGRSGMCRAVRFSRNWSWRLAPIALVLVLLVPRQDARAGPEQQGDAPLSALRAWHFAEGNSRSGSETFFTLRNLADQPASVTAQYNRDDGIRLQQWIGIEPGARISLNANNVVGARAFGASFFADQDIIVERTTTWGPGQNGDTMVGFAPSGQKAWHFAEGTTRSRATTYFVTQNLTDAPATVTATFTRDDGSTERRSFGLAPRGRDAFRVNDLLQDTAFSASVVADQDIIVERTIMTEGERAPTIRRLRDEKGRSGEVQTNGRTDDGLAMAGNAIGILGGLGYAATGPVAGSRGWEFAEGSTRTPFQTMFVVFNPGQRDTYVRFTFQPERGQAKTQSLYLPPLSRAAFDPRDLMSATDFATSISSDQPIVVERTYTSSGDGLYGALGYAVAPARTDSRTWLFAEGNTMGQTETYFVLFNLTPQRAQVALTYVLNDGSTREQALSLPASSRLAMRANETVPGQSFSARFLADRDILVERTVYLPGESGFTTVGAGIGRPER